MSDIWRRNGQVCTDDPRCFRECRCSRWLDYVNRFGNYVVPHPGGALPCYYLTFDGLNDIITLAGIALTPPFTMVAWTKRRVNGINHCMIGNSAALRAFRYSTNQLYFRHSTASTTGNIVSTAWEHVAVAAPAAVNDILYRNGVDVTVVPAIQAGAQTYNRIGSQSGIDLFDGQLAALGIAPAVLDIPAMWAAGDFHRPLNPTVFTAACWNMRNEGGAGVTLIDEAVGNDGTFLGAGEPIWAGLMSVGGPAGWSDS